MKTRNLGGIPAASAVLAIILTLPFVGCHGAARQSDGSPMLQTFATGIVPKTIDLNGETYRYAVYVPPDYSPRHPWPAVLFLHGAGERGDDGEKQTTVGIGKAIREHPERFPCLVIMPQSRPDVRWDAPMQALALAALDAAQTEYNIDPRRIVLTGLSLGGYGTWAIGAQHPDRFCALLPICGGGDPAAAPALARLPIWCFHGDADPVVSVEESRKMVAAVRAAGGNVRYRELPGVTHNSWDPAYGDPEVIAWMLQQRRP